MNFFLFFSVAVTKFCINCRHFIPSSYGPLSGKCSRFISEECHVTGNKEYKYCTTARSFDWLCGSKGKGYEALSNETLQQQELPSF